MSDNEEKAKCECEDCKENEKEFNGLILEPNEEEFDKGIKEASFLLGFGAVLNGLGLCEDSIAELIKVRMSCDTDLKIAEISSKMNIDIYNQEKNKDKEKESKNSI